MGEVKGLKGMKKGSKGDRERESEREKEGGEREREGVSCGREDGDKRWGGGLEEIRLKKQKNEELQRRRREAG